MKITRFVRIQLIIFSIVTVIAIVAVGIWYIRIPSMFGVGSYRVTLNLPSSGGLYQNANVSYRGVNVGKVDAVRLTENGVQATLVLDSGTEIPASSRAAVRSVSAIGEQFVELTPVPGSESGSLTNGSTLTSDDVPVEISTMLDQADALLAEIGDTKLRDVVDEAFTAFNGTGEDLQRLLDSMTLLAADARKNADVTIDLVEQAAPILATQSATTDEIRSWTADVTKVTDQIRASRPDITDILAKGPSAATQTQDLFDSMSQTLPMMISNLNVAARTMAVYLPNLQQIVVIYPRLMNALYTALNTGTAEYGANVNFSLGFQDPGTCTVGFLPASDWRPGSAQLPRDLPPGMLCRVPQDSNVAVRGARNFPCVEFPGRRAPTPAECRTGYTPVSDNNSPFPQGLPFGLKWGAQPSGYTVPASPTEKDASPGVYATSYDPQSGDFIGPDGKTYQTDLGQNPRAQGGAREQGSSWQSLVTGGMTP